MNISKETQERINLLFKTKPEMLEKLYNCDAEEIGKIGRLSQRGINPDDVIVAYESGDPSTMDYLYQQAKRLVELQQLYKELCFVYYEKTKGVSRNAEQSSSQTRSV